LNDLQFNHGITLTCGFEIEVTFLKRNPPGSSTDPYAPLTHTHAWGTLTPEDWLHLPLLADIATSLSSMGIDLQQFHSESGPGQYEFVLAPKPALEAIDALIQARQVISQIAALYDLRATLHPQPFPGTSGAGTAAHAHVSLSPPDRELDFFVGGVLPHLPAICAFTMPETSSYSRVSDDAWTGGSWVAWGTQNRETPLRKVERGHWEVRCVDGFANMYFAVAAIAAAGIRGLMAGTPSVPVPGPGLSPPTVPLGPPLQAAPAGLDASSPPPHPPSGVPQEQSYGPNVVSPQAAYYNRTHDEGNPYPHKDCTINPSQLTPEQRLTYGIARKLPRSIDEALGALDADTELRSQLGETWVHNFMIMKRSELEMLSKMGETERMVWLVERY
jgi:glutamine synthetase